MLNSIIIIIHIWRGRFRKKKELHISQGTSLKSSASWSMILRTRRLRGLYKWNQLILHGRSITDFTWSQSLPRHIFQSSFLFAASAYAIIVHSALVPYGASYKAGACAWHMQPNAPINVMPHPPSLGYTGKGGDLIKQKLMLITPPIGHILQSNFPCVPMNHHGE